MPDKTPPDGAMRTAATLGAAVRAIDAQFGEGYASANPTLVSAFLLSASAEKAILSGEQTVDRLDDRMQRMTDRVCTSLENLRPRLFG